MKLERGRRIWTAVAVALVAAAGGSFAAKRLRPHRGEAGEDVPAAFLRGAVRVALPSAWRVERVVAEGGSEGVALAIPCALLDATPHSANVNLLAEPNREGEDLAAWSARRLAVAAPRRTFEERVEPSWRTVVSTGVDRATRYVVVERFGVSPQGRVHAVAAFPCLGEMGEAWFERTGADIDAFLASLSLAGAQPSKVRVGWNGRIVRIAEPADPTAMR